METETLTADSVMRFWRDVAASLPSTSQLIAWVLHMRPEVYSRLLPMNRRKLQPYVRKAWRGHA